MFSVLGDFIFGGAPDPQYPMADEGRGSSGVATERRRAADLSQRRRRRRRKIGESDGMRKPNCRSSGPGRPLKPGRTKPGTRRTQDWLGGTRCPKQNFLSPKPAETGARCVLAKFPTTGVCPGKLSENECVTANRHHFGCPTANFAKKNELIIFGIFSCSHN